MRTRWLGSAECHLGHAMAPGVSVGVIVGRAPEKLFRFRPFLSELLLQQARRRVAFSRPAAGSAHNQGAAQRIRPQPLQLLGPSATDPPNALDPQESAASTRSCVKKSAAATRPCTRTGDQDEGSWASFHKRGNEKTHTLLHTNPSARGIQ